MANTYPNNKTPIFTDVNDVPVEATQTNPSNGSDLIAKLNQTLDWLDTDFSGIENDVSNLQSNVSANANDISTVQTDISNLQTSVSGNSNDISTNTTDIGNLQTDLSSLDSRVTTNENDIGTLQTDVSANTTNISTNTNDISSFQTDVSNLDTRVTANESDISTLQTDVTNNTTAISNNDSDISSLQSSVNTNANDITNNTQFIQYVEQKDDIKFTSLKPLKDIIYIDNALINRTNKEGLNFFSGYSQANPIIKTVMDENNNYFIITDDSTNSNYIIKRLGDDGSVIVSVTEAYTTSQPDIKVVVTENYLVTAEDNNVIVYDKDLNLKWSGATLNGRIQDFIVTQEDKVITLNSGVVTGENQIIEYDLITGATLRVGVTGDTESFNENDDLGQLAQTTDGELWMSFHDSTDTSSTIRYRYIANIKTNSTDNTKFARTSERLTSTTYDQEIRRMFTNEYGNLTVIVYDHNDANTDLKVVTGVDNDNTDETFSSLDQFINMPDYDGGMNRHQDVVSYGSLIFYINDIENKLFAFNNDNNTLVLDIPLTDVDDKTNITLRY